LGTFDYLSVLFSVVLGMALTQILLGLRAWMLARARVAIYWPALLWAMLMILIVVQVWWGMFAMREFRTWTFWMYAAVLLQITLLYLAAGLAVPDIAAEGAVDMRAHYFAHKNWFFGLLGATIASTMLKDFVTVGHVASGWNAAYLLLFFALTAVAVAVRRRWYHAILPPLSLAINAVYTTLMSSRL
jgi:hypothetical protein